MRNYTQNTGIAGEYTAGSTKQQQHLLTSIAGDIGAAARRASQVQSIISPPPGSVRVIEAGGHIIPIIIQ